MFGGHFATAMGNQTIWDRIQFQGIVFLKVERSELKPDTFVDGYHCCPIEKAQVRSHYSESGANL
jgi:hypothetical protein